MFKKILALILICFISAVCFGSAITSSPYNGDGWNTAAPNAEALRGNTYVELQDLRKGIGIRMAYEHTAFAASSVGGAHIPGGCNILFYGNTAAVDGNVAAGTFENFGLIYDTTLLQFFTMDAAETAKVAITIGTAGIADSGVKTADIADANVTVGKMAANSIDSAQYVDGSIDYEHLSAGAVRTAAIADSNVTLGKIDFFIDEDSMATDSAVKVPSQQSVKAYVGTMGTFVPAVTGAGTGYAGEESIRFPNGLIFKHGSIARAAEDTTLTFAAAFPTALVSITSTGRRDDQVDTYYPVYVRNPSTSGCTLTSYGTGGEYTSFYWQAWGY